MPPPKTTQGLPAEASAKPGRAPGKRQRVLSGMRPTGKLHIGNYFGALPNWLKLQADDSNDCYFFVADWHSLTSDYADTSQIAQNSIEIATDFLASGLDPNKSTIFQQSQIPEHAELHLLLSMVTPLGWLERVPTYKEALENIKGKDLHTFGFLGYPVLQTADIVMYGEPDMPLVVPVGEDQVAHVELGREIVRRFNVFYGQEFLDAFLQATVKPVKSVLELKWPGLKIVYQIGTPSMEVRLDAEKLLAELPTDVQRVLISSFRRRATEVGLENFLEQWGTAGPRFFALKDKLAEPRALLTPTPRVPGTDGRKMSKSYGNAITLGEDDESIRKKIRGMITDPARKLRTDPGNPDVCPVFSWHKLFSTPEAIQRVNRDCRTAAIGCVDCKHVMADALIRWIEPVRARRKEYESKPGEVVEILDAGSKKAREVAKLTMGRVREAVFGWQKTRAAITGGATATKRNIKGGD
ncbi:MAG: tryptophan--tRNA ligase [Candidatus Acidiferrales bacterium]